MHVEREPRFFSDYFSFSGFRERLHPHALLLLKVLILVDLLFILGGCRRGRLSLSRLQRGSVGPNRPRVGVELSVRDDVR